MIEVGDQTVIHGDCRDVLKQMLVGSVDVVATSPPYNLGAQYANYDDNRSESEYFDMLREVFSLISLVLKSDGSFFLNVGFTSDNPWLPFEVGKIASQWFTVQNRISWIKSISIDDGPCIGHVKPINSERYLNRQWEEIYHLTHNGNVKIDRLAVGVPYSDVSNLKRGSRGKNGNIRCRGNVWHVRETDNSDSRWLAMFLDAEGYICVCKNTYHEKKNDRNASYSATLQFLNSNLDLVQEARRIIGFGEIRERQPKPKLGCNSCRKMYFLQFATKEACIILARVYPYLIAKKRQAKCALYLEQLKTPSTASAWRTRLPEDDIKVRERLWQIVKALNHAQEPDVDWIPGPEIVYEGASDCWFLPYDTVQSRDDRGAHPTTFPLQVPLNCIKLHGVRDDLVVLDPFVGSGTTLLACQKLGVTGVGIDVDEASVRATEERLRAAI